MILGCLLLILVLNQYGFSTKVSALSTASPSAVALTATTAPLEKIVTVRL
jgi:hypothetical protein